MVHSLWTVHVYFFAGLEAPASDRGEGPGRFLTSEELEKSIEQLLDDPNREITPPDRLLSAIYAWKGTDLEDFKALADKLPRAVVRSKGFVSADGHTVRLFSWVMGRWTLEEAVLPPDRTALLNRVVFIAPPEALPQLEAISATDPNFCEESQRDPMAG